MYDIKWIREHRDAFDRGLTRRGLEPLSGELLEIDERRRGAIVALETALARRNAASKDIGQAKAKKDEATAAALMAEVGELKTRIPELERTAKEAEAELRAALANIPNTPNDDVPDGKNEDGNVEHHRFGLKRDYAFTPKQHFELGEALGLMDFEAAAKMSGARFVVLKGGLARLERALGQFMLDVHTQEHGYTEVAPPLLVRDDSMFGTAQLPKFRDDQFRVSPEFFNLGNFREIFKKAYTRLANMDETFTVRQIEHLMSSEQVETDATSFLVNLQEGSAVSLWLIPTAEVSLTNLARESIIDEDKLPLRYTACTPCFRAEAGAAGKDTRGMIRQHQFTKVELVSITTPEQSRDEHERMTACAEEVLRRLELPYRVMTLCTGDMGFASQKTYDIEVWLPGQNMYREISSCSVCGEFQARRMDARCREKGGRAIRHVHTLNGSGVAVGRALIAIMENYQAADGAIAVPNVLQPYMGGVKTIERTG